MSRDLILGFDTATADTTVAVTRDGEVVGESSIGPDDTPRHNAALLTEIERLVDEAGGWWRVARIGVGAGPGSYTGLRIGLATARALAQSTGHPRSFRSVRWRRSPGDGDFRSGIGRCCPLIDARRQEVFGALYDSEGGELWAPFVATPDQLLERLSQLDQPPLAFGDGSLRFRDELEAGGVAVADEADPAHRIQARCVCELAAQADPVPFDDVEPVYLRQPDAVRWHTRDDPSFR